MTHSDEEVVETLSYYRDLSSVDKNHQELIKDKKCIMYAAIALEDSDSRIVKLALEILENLFQNKETHRTLLSTFGVYEALESLAIRMRKVDERICKRATEITEILLNSAPPAYGTRSRLKRTAASKKTHTVYLLHIDLLNNKNKLSFENALLKIKGVISFVTDVEQHRCTLRICPKAEIKEIIETVMNDCKLKPLIVRKNIREGVETYCDVLGENANTSEVMEYEENTESTSPRQKALMKAAINYVTTDNPLIKSISSIAQYWNEAFYW